MRAFLRKRLDGSFVPACETSERLAKRVAVDELIETEWKSKSTRSVRWHRRYRAMLQLIYANSERFKSDDDVHLWLKHKTGFYDAMFEDANGGKWYVVRSIAFDCMTADEWEQWWQKAIDVVAAEILPGIELPVIEYEIQRVAGLAA